MKKTFFLLFAGGFLFAQNSELFTNNWYISKIVTAGQTVTTPAMSITLSQSEFTTYPSPGSGYAFNSRHFNSCQIATTFTGVNTFTKMSSACTLAMYGGNNASAVNSFDQQHTDFYIYPALGSTFEYEIVANSSGKTLIITNPSNGNKVFYNNSNLFLGTKETEGKNDFVTFVNPVKERLIIENIENNLSIQIFNMLGQKIYEGKTADHKVQVDTQNFAAGLYMLIIQNKKPYRFIKE